MSPVEPRAESWGHRAARRRVGVSPRCSPADGDGEMPGGKYQQRAALLSDGDGLALGAARQGHQFEAAATPVALSAWAQAERGGQEGCLLG